MRLLALTIFLSSFLVFQVQPLIGKHVLPWFGGAPQVWTACMLFFQTALFGGYAYAHFIAGHFTIKRQVLIHALLLLATLLLLPISPPDYMKPDAVANPTLWILLVLTVSVGGPFLLISSTAPLLQSWFGRAFPGHSPYRLYALSNAASLLSLFSYPFVMEPWLTLPAQTWTWSIAYFVFVIFCIGTGWKVTKIVAQNEERHDLAPSGKVAVFKQKNEVRVKHFWVDVFLWLFLSFCGSVMLLAVTNQLCQNVASLPFLWIVPLAIYLLTFILCFESDVWYRRGLFVPLWLGVLVLGVWLGFGGELTMPLQIAAYCLILFVCCMVCHGELARLRPRPKKLTLFYLLMSFGGLLGGFFVSVVAPIIFTLFYEFYVGLIGCGVALSMVLRRDLWQSLDGAHLKKSVIRTSLAGAVIVIFVTWISLNLGVNGLGNRLDSIAIYRDFYGVVSVQRLQTSVPGQTVLRLTHGDTTHGLQYELEAKRGEPLAYYRRDAGIGLALLHNSRRQRSQTLRVGVIGLGVGALAAYAEEEDVFDFYELDPNVEWFARQFFTYLSDAEGRGAEINVYLDDGRLSLERNAIQILAAGAYDVIVLDAFSSDSVPVHLLTEEAFDLYKELLSPEGILAVHISNRHLDLAPVVRAGAEHIGSEAHQYYGDVLLDSDLPEILRMDSHWILISDQPEFFQQAEMLKAATPWPADGRKIQWTDHFSSLFEVLK